MFDTKQFIIERKVKQWIVAKSKYNLRKLVGKDDELLTKMLTCRQIILLQNQDPDILNHLNGRHTYHLLSHITHCKKCSEG